jgi:DNA-binding NarL/FixJ family response regulator
LGYRWHPPSWLARSSVYRRGPNTLSSREREIMFQATAGRLNKQIAHEMDIAISTVKVHRTNLMRKMKARSLPELSRSSSSQNHFAIRTSSMPSRLALRAIVLVGTMRRPSMHSGSVSAFVRSFSYAHR